MDTNTQPILKIDVTPKKILVFLSLKIIKNEIKTFNKPRGSRKFIIPRVNINFNTIILIGPEISQIEFHSKIEIRFKYQEWKGKTPSLIVKLNKIITPLKWNKEQVIQKYSNKILAKLWIEK